MPRFVNLWDAGLKLDLVTDIAAAMDSADDGEQPNKRFVSVREDKDAPPSKGERRLLLADKDDKGKPQDAMRLIKRLRAAADIIGVRSFYVPKGTRGALSVGADDARWLHQKGYSATAIADLFGVSQRSAWMVVKGVPVEADATPRKNHGDSFDERDFRTGADWLRGRRLSGDPTSAKPHEVDELVTLLGPSRIARVGAALRALRAAKRPDPPKLG